MQKIEKWPWRKIWMTVHYNNPGSDLEPMDQMHYPNFIQSIFKISKIAGPFHLSGAIRKYARRWASEFGTVQLAPNFRGENGNGQPK